METPDVETRPQTSATSLESPADRAPPRAIDPSMGQQLGRYAVLAQIGGGGMGRVLRAYDPKLEREVALKLLHTHALGTEAQARLVREARAMAMLSHPNVVAVHDVDDTPLGVMLVMELVRGQTLRAWLRAGERPWHEVVTRFGEAGRGLAAAHAVGLLHRDFKPSNVLVPERGAAKVTDFGLAKLGPEQDPSASRSSGSFAVLDTMVTHAGEVVGTPRYMAPEQHAGEALGPAADQYGFCVSLWEALCGRPPFDGRWDALLAAKRKGPPPWPVGAAVPSSVVAAIRRGLAPEPAERWPSMGALLDVLDPAQRRSGWRTAGTVALVGLVGAIGWRVWALPDGTTPCTGAEAQLAGAWGPGRRDAVLAAMGEVGAGYATRVRRETVDALDRYATAWAAAYTEACEATTVRGELSPEVMDLRMACLRQARLELDAVTAVLAEAEADVVQRAHELTDGLPPLSRCDDLEALRATVAPPRPEELEAVGEVRALLAQARALHVSGRYAAAQEQLEAASAAAQALAYEPVRTELALLEGTNLGKLGKPVDSEAALRRALELGARWRQLDLVQDAATRLVYAIGAEQPRMAEGLQHRELALGLAAGNPRAEASVMTVVAFVLEQQGDYAQAEAQLRQALALRELALGSDHLDVALSRNNLANVLVHEGRYAEAEAEHRLALALRERLLGPEHPDVAMSHNNLANVLRRQGKLPEAEASLRQALAVLVAALGPDHPDLAKSHSGLGNVLVEQGKLPEAEVQLRRALALVEAALGPDHPDVAVVRSNVGNAAFARGRYAEAEVDFQRALTVMEAALGPDHPNTAVLRSNHAEALHALGRHREAELEHRQALARLDVALGPEHPEVAKLRTFLAATLAAQGKHDDAEAELRRALAVLEGALGPDHPDVADARARLADTLRARTTPREHEG